MIRTLLLAVLLAAVLTMFTSPDEWLKKGFDITDDKLTDDPKYRVTVKTQCNVAHLNQTPHEYNGTVRSGYLSLNKGNSVLAFIFYGKENVDQSQLHTVPTILWLNGGPGSSSQLGNMFELGPFRISPGNGTGTPYNIKKNEHAWTTKYNVLFVDQPTGTGISYADNDHAGSYVKSQSQLADDFYYALNQLYNTPDGCFNQLGIKGSDPLFVFGESYGGKYAPAIGLKIFTEMRDRGGFLTGLKGVAIGDGFTAPTTTLNMMGEFAYNFGLLDYQERSKIEQYILNSTYQELNSRWRDLHISFYKVLNTITDTTGGVNVYDITEYKPYPTDILKEYFGSRAVQDMYGLNPDIVYDSQHHNVGEALYQDFMKNQVNLVQQILLYSSVPVLVYSGQNDLIVQTPGTLRWVEDMHYNEAEAFKNTLLTPWKINGKMAGFWKKVGRLELRILFNAGHLVPMDQPVAALDMVDSFVGGALKTAVK